MSRLAPYAKTVVAFVGFVVTQAIAQGLLSGPAASWASLVIGGLTVVGVYAVPNSRPGVYTVTLEPVEVTSASTSTPPPVPDRPRRPGH